MTAPEQTSSPIRAAYLTELLQRPANEPAASDPLRPILASLLAGRACGEGVLPAKLGLPEQDFAQLVQDYFPGQPLALQSGGVLESLELSDIIHLLLANRAGQQPSEVWLAHILAWGCAGRHHLWHDLGLANRGELSLLMNTAFPALAALNTTDMKWKKFIYRHYCSTEGIYLCPAPSCGECADYAKCHSPEA